MGEIIAAGPACRSAEDQHGQIEVLNHNIADRHLRDTPLLPRIAYMPQGLGRNLYPTLSVTENVDFCHLFGQQRRERLARIKELLNATGLAPFS